MRTLLDKIIPTTMDEITYRGLPALAGVIVSAMIGVEYQLMLILAILIVCDYITGVLSAWVSRTVSSDESLRGIAKKLGAIGLLVLAHQLDKLLNQGYPIVQTVAYWLLIANEGISITENLAELGVPIPTIVLDALAKVSQYQTTHQTVPSQTPREERTGVDS